MDEEDLKSSLINMLPGGLSMEFLMKVNEYESYANLKDWLRQKAEFISEHVGNGLHTIDHDKHEQEESDELDEDTVAQMEPGQILAMLRTRTGKGAGKGAGRFIKKAYGTGNSGGVSRPEGAQRAKSDLKCVNCGKTGHTAVECRGAKVDREKRHCFNCGKTGHLAKDCASAKARPANMVEQAHGQGGDCYALCVTAEDDAAWPTACQQGFQVARRTFKKAKAEAPNLCNDFSRGLCLADYITKTVWNKLECPSEEDELEADPGKFPDSQAVTVKPISSAKSHKGQTSTAKKDPNNNVWLTRSPAMSNVAERLIKGDKDIDEVQLLEFVEETQHAGLNIITQESDEDVDCMISTTEWVDIEFEAALDSGAFDHVCHEADAPGYALEESTGSRRGQHFIVGDGNRIPNKGRKKLNLAPNKDDDTMVQSCFQIAKVTRPLMSVGKIRDGGMDVKFDKDKALILNPQGKEICRFTRDKGGLYTCKMKLKAPFTRQD